MAPRSSRAAQWYAPEEHLGNDELVAERYPRDPSRVRLPGLSRPLREADALLAPRSRGRRPLAHRESYASLPGSSVSGLYFGHPAARYFAVGRIGRDQVEDYAERRGMELATAERWLRPNLAYDPR